MNNPNAGSRRGSRRTRKRDYLNPNFVIDKAFTRMRAYNNFKRKVEVVDEKNDEVPTVTKFDGKYFYV